jgi:hypothetical protein
MLTRFDSQLSLTSSRAAVTIANMKRDSLTDVERESVSNIGYKDCVRTTLPSSFHLLCRSRAERLELAGSDDTDQIGSLVMSTLAYMQAIEEVGAIFNILAFTNPDECGDCLVEQTRRFVLGGT